MLRQIGAALSESNPLRGACAALADAHLEAGWQDALHDDYMVSHWAPSFLLYALTCGPAGSAIPPLIT